MGVDPALGCEPSDGSIHQAAVDEGKPQSLSHAAPGGRFAGRHATVYSDDHLPLPTCRGGGPKGLRGDGLSAAIATALCSAATSASPSTRHPPVFRRPSFSGPKPTRRSEWTLWPIACSMRRTWRCLPSRITIRTSAIPESRLPGVIRSTSTSAGAVTPSSSLTPLRKVSTSELLGLPLTCATYSFASL